MDGGSRHRALAAGAAAGIVLVAFAARFLPLGGTLGGFDNDHFVHLLRTDMLLHGEQPLRDFADAELRGAWPSLGYAASAWAQQLGGPTLLSEAYLTVGGLALSTGGVFLLALQLSRRWLVALLAAACLIAAHPKLYNYEKAVVLFIGLLLVYLWARGPSAPRLAALSAWTAIAALVRHDFAVYVGLAAVLALVGFPAPAAVRVRRVAGYAALTAVLLIPSMLWIQQHAGLVEYLQRTIESARSESLRTELEWPVIDPEAGIGERENVLALTYYLFWAVPLSAALLLLALTLRGTRARRQAGVERRRAGPSPDATMLAVGWALVACALAVNLFFLRGNLIARFGDAAVPVVLAAAWAAGARRGAFSGSVPTILLAAVTAVLWFGGDVRAELRTVTTRVDSMEDLSKHVDAVHTALARMPPAVWTDAAATGTLTASRYLAECTEPSDRVLMATYAPEVPVFARRLFAAGQGTFGLAFYESEAQQREAVARLQRQSVPVVLGSYDDFEGEFAEDYRHVYEYVAAHYRDAGAIAVNGRPWFRVLVDTRREPRRVHPVFQLPCFT